MNQIRRWSRLSPVVLALALIGAACTPAAPTPAPPAATPTPPPAATPTPPAAATPTPAEPVATPTPEPATPTPSPEPASVIVALNWPVPEYTHTGITMAQVRGYYEEENLTVELAPQAGTAIAVQTVGAGTAQIAFAGAAGILAGISQDLPIIAVANHLQATPTGVLYRPQPQPINSFEDLRGLTISTQATGEDTVNLFAFLRLAGLNPDTDVNIQFVDGGVKCTLMLAGTTDACTGFNTGHLVRARQEQPDIGFLHFSTPDLQPIGHSIVVNTDWLQQGNNEDVLRRFLRATYRGYLEADQNLEELAQTYIELYPEEGLDLYYESSVQAHEIMRSPRTEQHGWGWMEDQPWDDLQTLLFEAGTITEMTPVSEIYTNEYLPENADF